MMMTLHVPARGHLLLTYLFVASISPLTGCSSEDSDSAQEVNATGGSGANMGAVGNTPDGEEGEQELGESPGSEGEPEGEAAQVDGRQGALGDVCTPGDVNFTGFSGYSSSEVNVESGTDACASGICLVNGFQGRPGCPYGQDLSEPDAERCRTPAGELVEYPVSPQLLDRRPEDHVTCSCRCDGPDPDADYCACPAGMVCELMIEDLGLGTFGEIAGSYCIPALAAEADELLSNAQCDRDAANCE